MNKTLTPFEMESFVTSPGGEAARGRKIMSNNKHLAVLFLGSFVILLAGMGLFPILPLVAGQYGATRTEAGLFLTILYVAITAGSFTPGWLAGRISRRAQFIAAGLIGIPGLALMGQVTTFWGLVGVTAVVWYSGGVGLALISVFTALAAGEKKRGRSFGLMSLATPLGSLVGGVFVSALLAWRDYATLFGAFAIIWLSLPLIGLFGLPAESNELRVATTGRRKQAKQPLGPTFYTLGLISLVAAVAVNVGRFGATVSMQTLGFSADAVASTAAISGLVTIPIVLSISTLSDQMGRKRFLALGYLLSAVAVAVLLTAVHLWHFWLAATLVLVSRSVSDSVSAALATDLLEPATVARGLPLLNGLNRAGGIVSFVSAGLVMDGLGTWALYGITAVLALAAAFQLAQLKRKPCPATVRPALAQTPVVVKEACM
jgi:MFS family permease